MSKALISWSKRIRTAVYATGKRTRTTTLGTLKDLDTAVAGIQRDILQIADYLQAVNANLNLLRYYQSVLKQDEVKYITNEEALDLGIAVLLEETGQLIEPIPVRRN